MSISSVMATIPIVSQTPMTDIFGQNACHVFWTASMANSLKMVTSGTGMAIYRLFCFHFLFKRDLDTKKTVKMLLIAEWILIFGMISMKVIGFNMFGWDKAILYQYCMDIGNENAQILFEHKMDPYNDPLSYKILRFGPNLVIHVLMVVELVIYLWIIFHLWKHDQENFKEKVITEDMRNERNQKNIITLKGQIITFVIEFAYGICAIFLANNLSLADPSAIVIIKMIGSTVIAVVQLFTSHEMKRFIRSHFNMF